LADIQSSTPAPATPRRRVSPRAARQHLGRGLCQ
jgi:hypothetical protein